MALAHVDTLPEEIQLWIFNHLESTPPSELKSREEPSAHLTSSGHHLLKDISLVSKRWRRIVLPLLFRHARLIIDITPRPAWAACPACSTPDSGNLQRGEAAPFSVDQSHFDRMEAVKHHAAIFLSMLELDERSSGEFQEQSYKAAAVAWASRLHHALEDFLEFLRAGNLYSSIQSIVLSAGCILGHRITSPFTVGDHRYPAAAALWQDLFATIDPDRIVIIAPPTELASLVNAPIDFHSDWAFGDMEFHVLELRQDCNRVRRLTDRVKYSELKPYPLHLHSFAPSSVIHLRPWTHVSLNEGSFLKAYGTYEYFERGPPSLVYSIKQCLAPPTTKRPRVGISGSDYLPALRSFSYTAMFPFANHANFADLLPLLEELDLQFAPNTQSGILDDKGRTGKAELEDCWQELYTAYHHIARKIDTFWMSEEEFPKLKKFVCRDSRIPALQADLDEIFTPLCLPVWVEAEPGVFTRMAMSPGLSIADHMG